MGGKSGGGGQTGASAEAERLAKIQADISQGIFNQTGPIRQQSLDAISGDLRDPSRLSGAPITAEALGPIDFNSLANNPQFGALKDSVETQFAGARNQLIGDAPTGGALTGALGNLGGQRASELTRGFGGLAQQEAGRQERERLFDVGLQETNRDALTRAVFGSRANALSAGSGGAAQGISGISGSSSLFGNLAATQAQTAQAEADRSAGKASGIGQGVGSVAGAAVSNPAMMAAMTCSREYKMDFEPVADADMLRKINSATVERWRYRPGTDTTGGDYMVGPIAEETPRDFVSGDGKGVYEISLVGGLMCAVRELTRRLEALEGS